MAPILKTFCGFLLFLVAYSALSWSPLHVGDPSSLKIKSSGDSYYTSEIIPLALEGSTSGQCNFINNNEKIGNCIVVQLTGYHKQGRRKTIRPIRVNVPLDDSSSSFTHVAAYYFFETCFAVAILACVGASLEALQAYQILQLRRKNYY